MASEARGIGLVVLNWNGMAVLERCLASLERAADTSRHRVELLLVDNDSSDGSDRWAEAEHPRWELLRTGANLRYGGGMNAGLERCLERGLDYVLLLNNDIQVGRGMIDPLVDDLEAATPRGAASPRIHYFDRPDRIWYAGGKVSSLARVTRHRGIRRHATGRLMEAGATEYLTGCAIMGKAEFWRETGGFDPEFPFYAEDVDLSLRAREAGWTLRYVPASMILHRVGFASGGGLGAPKLRAQLAATARLLRRHVPAALRPLAYAAWIFHLAGRLIAARCRGERRALSSAAEALRKERNSS